MKHQQWRRNLGAVAAFGAIIFAAVVISSTRGWADKPDKPDKPDKHEDPRVERGLAIAPVTLDFKHKDREVVGLGSYLVNAVSGCNDCHTEPSYTNNPFRGDTPKQVNTAGYLAGGRNFFGPITSRNLTPDKAGNPAGATLSEFVAIMRTGVDPDAWHPAFGPLLQVMPWPVYQDMTDEDLRAIYEYLSAIPCVEGDPGNPAGSDTKGMRCH